MSWENDQYWSKAFIMLGDSVVWWVKFDVFNLRPSKLIRGMHFCCILVHLVKNYYL